MYDDQNAKQRAYYERNKERFTEKRKNDRIKQRQTMKQLTTALQKKEAELTREKYKLMNFAGAIDRAMEMAEEDEPIREANNLSEGEKLASRELRQRRTSTRTSTKPSRFTL